MSRKADWSSAIQHSGTGLLVVTTTKEMQIITLSFHLELQQSLDMLYGITSIKNQRTVVLSGERQSPRRHKYVYFFFKAQAVNHDVLI